MSRDLDARARQAAAGLKTAVEAAEFTSTAPVPVKARRPLVAVIRPAIVVALLMIGAAVGVAVVMDGDADQAVVPTTIPAVPTTVAPPPSQPEAAPPTTAYVPPTTAATTAPDTTVAPDLEPPFIEVTSPEEGAEFETKTVTFEGVTEPGAKVAAGRWEADVDDAGNWSIVLILSEGKNTARFTATDEAGNEAQASVTVYYVAETTTTTTKKEIAEFSAHATFGSCSEEPPYDIYYGTGEPGTIISITSKYGSGEVEVNEEGEWEKKVIFETAPPDKTFVVTVSDEFGRSKQFEMVYQPA